MIVARLPHRVAGPAREGKPNLRRARREHLRRHHADDSVGLVAEVYRAPEHVRVARKNALPKFITDHANQRTAHAIFLFGENAAQLWREPDDFEKIRGNETAGDLLRRATLEPD